MSAPETVHTGADPMATACGAVGVEGITFLRRVAAGAISVSAIASTFGVEVDSVAEGRVVFSFVPAEFHDNPTGSLHGGVYVALLDSAAGCAVHSMLPAGARYTDLDLTVKFLRALTHDTGRATCEGSVIHMGGRTALAEARLLDGDGRLCAYASSSCVIIRPGT
jgi:uncharacterized protein (TIGR00369 family)